MANPLSALGWSRNSDGTYCVFRVASGHVIVNALDLDTPINAHFGVLAQHMRHAIRNGATGYDQRDMPWGV